MKRILRIVLAALFTIALTSCSGSTVSERVSASQSETTPDPSRSEASGTLVQSGISATQAPSSGEIYLYGEMHASEAIMEKENELWYDYYHNEGMRHLFIEMPYYTAEFLNLWMQSDNDEILDAVYDDWEGSSAHNPYVRPFYRKIKEECPETIFHGTDVGHQYDTTGERFLEYLRKNNLEDTPQYQIAQEAIGQGKNYYDNDDPVYRENKMAENFIREYDQLSGESVMGIYGAAHIGIDAELNFSTESVPSMAKQLYASYGDALHTEDISFIREDIAPERVDAFTIGGKEYQASFYGKEDLAGNPNFASRAIWRLEHAYEDFKDHPKTGDFLPYNNYPMQVEEGQVFIVELIETDGSVRRGYYRSDGNQWEGLSATEEFRIDSETNH